MMAQVQPRCKVLRQVLVKFCASNAEEEGVDFVSVDQPRGNERGQLQPVFALLNSSIWKSYVPVVLYWNSTTNMKSANANVAGRNKCADGH
jgi:hypothetical protein